VAAFANSTAIGQGAATTRANQMVFGTAANTYTAPGITSAASAAAQTGATQLVTSDASGNLATESASTIVASSPAFQSLQQDVKKNTQGVGVAIAMGSGVGSLPPGQNFGVAVNWGTFEGLNAVAASGTARLYDSLYFNGSVGVGCNEGTVGGRAGLAYSW
jgi:hypothetical protein